MKNIFRLNLEDRRVKEYLLHLRAKLTAADPSSVTMTQGNHHRLMSLVHIMALYRNDGNSYRDDGEITSYDGLKATKKLPYHYVIITQGQGNRNNC